MKKILIPLILFLVGSGGGVGAGLFLVKPAAPEEHAAAEGEDPAASEGEHAAEGHEGAAAEAPPAEEEAAADGEPTAPQYVPIPNQFIVPVVQDGQIAAMVILSISLEAPADQVAAVGLAEPKLRDAFLQVMFDHSNTGGFSGNYTASSNMRQLRAALLAAAQDNFGPQISDVLITNIVRQDP